MVSPVISTGNRASKTNAEYPGLGHSPPVSSPPPSPFRQGMFMAVGPANRMGGIVVVAVLAVVGAVVVVECLNTSVAENDAG